MVLPQWRKRCPAGWGFRVKGVVGRAGRCPVRMGLGKSALQASLRCRFPEALARISGSVPQISLLSQTAAIARSSRIYWVFISGSRVSGFSRKAFLKPLMDTYGASSMEEAMPCGLGFSSDGICGTELDFVQCAWARENRPGKRACDTAFPKDMPASADPSLKSLWCPKLRPLPAVQESIEFLSVVPAPAVSLLPSIFSATGRNFGFFTQL